MTDQDPQSHLPLTHVAYHVLLALTRGPSHGYGIIKDVARRTAGRLEIEAGTLYAAIKRMREDGLLRSAEAPEDADSRRRYYTLTDHGRDVLLAESRRLEEMVELARDARVLSPRPQTGG